MGSFQACQLPSLAVLICLLAVKCQTGSGFRFGVCQLILPTIISLAIPWDNNDNAHLVLVLCWLNEQGSQYRDGSAHGNYSSSS